MRPPGATGSCIRTSAIHCSGQSSVHSVHLYQIYAYLRNLERRGGPDAQAEGILLYPAVSQRIDLR